mmetsp:Transcript_35288/g.64561  ORF Transcript_35288/g.64561 Transcript_35288/m.64561 type:complete len:190 (-) Transcript_35288:63-632(-)
MLPNCNAMPMETVRAQEESRLERVCHELMFASISCATTLSTEQSSSPALLTSGMETSREFLCSNNHHYQASSNSCQEGASSEELPLQGRRVDTCRGEQQMGPSREAAMHSEAAAGSQQQEPLDVAGLLAGLAAIVEPSPEEAAFQAKLDAIGCRGCGCQIPIVCHHAMHGRCNKRRCRFCHCLVTGQPD